MAIETVAVIGCGTMGNGIAQVMATQGKPVLAVDLTDEALQRGLATIEKSLGRVAKKGKLEEAQIPEILGRIRSTTSLQDCASVDLVVEAAAEDEDLKCGLFSDLDGICGPDTILTSNTSSISITRIAAATRRPDKVIGMHFMNPVPVMKLVEVVRGLDTSDATTDAVNDLSAALGKIAVPANDFPGFVSNRILMPMINEAVFCLMEGVATRESIDEILKLGMAHPMGPLTLADLIGLDICLDIMEVLHGELGDGKYRPCPLLRKMVAAGHLGRKSGRGFYEYDA